MTQKLTTIQDYLDLLNAVKEKYGNIQVKAVTDTEIGNVDEYWQVEDAFIHHDGIQSLMKDHVHYETENNTTLVFVTGW